VTTPLKILTWNIWMMPKIAHSPKNEARADAIATELLARDFDILCLEKAFDPSARNVLAHRLGERYPYRYGPINQPPTLSLEISGGVWVLSRVPLQPVHTIQFRDDAGWEHFSRKGAILLHGDWQGDGFQLIATHLQGENAIDSNHQAIRDKQIAQIANELIAQHADRDLPLFLCGDFNTERRDRKDPFAESKSYLRMLELFGAVNGEEQRGTLEDRRAHNDLAEYDSGRVAELDYILLHTAGKPIEGNWSLEIMRHQGWDGPHGRRDLSYRFAVGATFTFGRPRSAARS
jgi:endonuclease/exonuclease/phosphatase family metal-dependent hydrolase